MAENLPNAVWSGSFTIYGVELKCHVLDNGQRIIEADSMRALLEAMGSPDKPEMGDIADFARWKNGG